MVGTKNTENHQAGVLSIWMYYQTNVARVMHVQREEKTCYNELSKYFDHVEGWCPGFEMQWRQKTFWMDGKNVYSKHPFKGMVLWKNLDTTLPKYKLFKWALNPVAKPNSRKDIFRFRDIVSTRWSWRIRSEWVISCLCKVSIKANIDHQSTRLRLIPHY